MEAVRLASPRPRVALTVGLAVVAAFVAAGLGLMRSTTFDIWGAFFLAPVLVVISLPVLARQADREGDRLVFYLLAFALLVKLAGAVVRHYVAFEVYGGRADAAGYHVAGVEFAERFRAGNFSDIGILRGTNFIRVLTGVVYTIIGPSRLAGFIFFSWLGFWGLFLFYRAFVIAIPEGRPRVYARYLFFLPSLLFWPSSIGKETWMVFSLGIAAFGGAQVLTGKTWRGLVIGGVGLWFAAIVRPHTAALLGIAVAAAYLIRRPPKELRHLGPVVKVVLLGALAFGTALLIARTDRFLQEAGIDTQAGVGSVFSQVTARTEQGGSRFGPSAARSPVLAPIALATVLFRPFPFEARNPQSLVAALEGTFLLVLTLSRVPSFFRRTLPLARGRPYVVVAVVYALLFLVAFSSIANFGILVRQRAQLLPLYVVLLAIPSRGRERADAATA